MEEIEKIKKQKRKQISHKDYVSVWLKKVFNKTYKEVEETYIKQEDGEYSEEDRTHFLTTYSVTQEQHDWWEDVCKPIFIKNCGLIKKYAESQWGWFYLDCAPKVKNEQI